MFEIPELDEALRDGDPLAAACRDVIGKMLAQAIRDVKAGCQKSAKWLAGPEARYWMTLTGLEPAFFYKKLEQELEKGDKSMTASRIDRRSAAEIRRDQADQTRQEAIDRQAAAESQHQERAGKVTGRVLDSGLFPQRAPSFASGFASHMGLLSDAMSGDAKAQAEYRILGETGQTGQKKERDTDVKTKDVKGDDLAARFTEALGPCAHPKPVAGPVTLKALKQRPSDIEGLARAVGELADNIKADDSISDKATAVSDVVNEAQSIAGEYRTGLHARRRLKHLVRRELLSRGFTW